ncbi:MAG TPA: type II toxin-antitoxin system prevent-host-death family antitoxin [Actinophytocola sp.]|uniref:type II toxin-antitoxin system Phd/YefM family antitoxin n=1 Tax=Actinophytocola sp. TaxID=1872138 RepID=UPI002DB5C066|nr:type II toxin-antitoxin system prevent-host-death family antitoxin [Actinophytocola sp.]HEU5469588.1 type II toxin-antitoxin system prevent-host-death family antitoxin [Actinophytocola sp.]
MEQVPVRVLNQDTAGVLARVENGEVVEITSRGKPIARIIPIVPREIEGLVAAGRLIPATDRTPFPMPPGDVDETGSASAALIAMREEERW